MDRIAIVYWSGQGATKEMAECVKKGVEAVGKTADLYVAADFGKNLSFCSIGFLFFSFNITPFTMS